MANNYLLLTPGPLTTTPTVKQVMMDDWCTWDADYNQNIVQTIRQKLVQLATKQTQDYTAVLMQGSGTYCVESVLGTVLKPEDRLLVLANGAYGERMYTMAKMHGTSCDIIRFGETHEVDPRTVADYLDKNPEVTHVGVVHSETTTGILNPLEEIARVVKNERRKLIVDAMSSFGGVPMDAAELGIDYLVSSANKCIQGVPGFGFIIARKADLEQCQGTSKCLSLDLYDQWKTMEEGGGKWRFTSPTHVVRAFSQAIEELEEEGGIEVRNKRYTQLQSQLSDGMKKLGYEPLLRQEIQSPIITSFRYPSKDFDFAGFYQKLKAKGFVIYPGKISQESTFRIGNIGDVHSQDIDRLLEAIAQVQREQAAGH